MSITKKDWATISAENAEKVSRFAKAATVIAQENLEMSPLVRQRKLPGGRTLFEAIAAGGDGAMSATILVQMLRSEAEQREMLSTRFAGRASLNTEGINDAPTVYRE